MRSNLPFIVSRIPLNLAESGTDIGLEWDVAAGGTFDAVMQTTAGGTVTRATAKVKGFVHYVQIAKQGVLHFNEFEQGDCILDLAPEAAIDGKTHLRFTIASQPGSGVAISAVADDGTGNFRLTSVAHARANGDWVLIFNSVNYPAMNGLWTIEDVTANTFDLDGTTFAGTGAADGAWAAGFERWVAKELGEAVPMSWDVVAQGQRLYRSVLLKKAT